MSPTARLRRCGRGRFRSERGVALVEFALVLPFLLLIIFGMVDLGKAVSYWNDQTHLANLGARYAAVNSCAACGAQTINAYIPTQAETAELRTQLATAPAGKAGVFIRFPGTGSKNHCAGQAVKVTIKSTYDLPFLGKVPIFGSALGLSDIHITASSTTRLEQNWVGDSNGNPAAADKYFTSDPNLANNPDPTNPSHDAC